jgi:hypothetical protein
LIFPLKKYNFFEVDFSLEKIDFNFFEVDFSLEEIDFNFFGL